MNKITPDKIYDTAPQHLLSLTIDVVLPGNLQIHLDVTLDDVN